MKGKILERIYSVKGQNTVLILSIFDPEFEDGLWKCNYEIKWPDSDETFSYMVFGVDKFDAISWAIEIIRGQIISEMNESGVLIIWPDGANGRII